MKINNAQILFNSQHEKLVNEQIQQQRIESQQTASVQDSELELGSSTELQYEANLRHQQQVEVSATSRIKSAEEEILFKQSQNIGSLVETAIQHELEITRVQPLGQFQTINIPLPVVSLESQAYQEIEQINLQDVEGLERADRVELQDQLQIQIDQISVEMDLMRDVQEARVEIQEQRLYEENEQMRFASQGVVTTEDGKEITFMLELEMEREFSLEENLQLEKTSRTLIDPLVINFNGGAAGLTSSSFSFDLNADGQEEEISFVTQGSGFLALDMNEDGVINDGSELFGTQGQNGFSHLAKYDGDGNLWIDENDEIFNKLKVWTRDDQGNDQLISLKDAGVGAIYLGSTSTNFDLTDSENNLLGQVKRSGVFLTEEGMVASIQELDIAVHSRDEVNSIVGQANDKAEQLAAEEVENPNINRIEMLPIWESDLAAIEFNAIRVRHELENSLTVESETTRTLSSAEGETEAEKSYFILNEHYIDTLQRLREKTVAQVTEEQDQYDHLRSLIEMLRDQTQRDMQKT
ncbi:hypothetical protein [Neptuniibacter sp.]|uniref:hypothetical protein n=1 Tax=Neptuniibacter sp. TaxID=1962643 RepID=UPI00261DB67F|nr:hypothetical protein [Neptuniibacter sp.]MCP4596879.1 hypothetical protein [Neptuniibacter sp.]